MITKDNFLLHIKKIEEELNLIKNDIGHKQSNIFKTIINLSPNAISIVYKGNYVYANPTALLYFGVKSEEEILNKPVLETIHPEFHEKIVNRMKAVSRGKKNEAIVIKLKRADNQEIYIETVSIPIKYKGEVAALIVGKDITDEYIIKKQLEENEKLLEETERLSKIGRYKINLSTGKATWSKGLYNIFNFSYDTPLPDVDSYYKYVHPQDIDKVKSMLADCVLNDASFDLKYRIILPSNIIRHVHSKGEVKTLVDGDKYLVGFYRDITEEVEKENRIKEGEYHLRLLFDTIQEGIALNEAIYDEDGNIEDYKILF